MGRISVIQGKIEIMKSEDTVFITPFCLLIVGCFKVVFNVMLVK